MGSLLAKIADKLRTPYSWSRTRRAEVVEFLSRRQPLTHEDWQRRFAPDIPLDFVRWFRDACSRYFEFDLSAALPEDRLIEDLGLFYATWPDVDWDIFEDFEDKFGAERPRDPQPQILTFGDFLRRLWNYAQKSAT
jgi:hypothetical protein